MSYRARNFELSQLEVANMVSELTFEDIFIEVLKALDGRAYLNIDVAIILLTEIGVVWNYPRRI